MTLAFTSLVPLNVRKPPHVSALRVSLPHKPRYYACQSQESKPMPSEPVAPEPVAPEPVPSKPVLSEPAPLAQRNNIPALFRGPEAVLGIVIAAAALLADFSRSLARLISRPRSTLKSAHDLDESIDLLTTALDASKAALADTESRLDKSLARASSAEAALLGIGDTREAIRRARETTADAEAELRRITLLLVQERERFEKVEDEKGENVEKREEFEKAIKERESEVNKLRAMIAEAQETEEQIENSYKSREEELRVQMNQKEQELEAVRAERLRAEEQALDLEARAATVAEQAEAAESALEDTKRELERVQSDLEARQEERKLIDAESVKADERSKEATRLRKMVSDMERELSELQAELRSRDQVVNEFAMESDELRSLLAARDAELRDVSSRLDSAMTSEATKGGDSALSEMSLNEIQRNLDAETLALSAEITKAELASFDLTENDLDPLDRIKKKLGAEENLLQAGLRKAESTVRLEEHLGARKEGAVDEVLKSINHEGEEEMSVTDVEEDQTSASYLTQDEESSASSTAAEDIETAVVAEEVGSYEKLDGEPEYNPAENKSTVEPMVAKQAQMKTPEPEAKPKKRRGRPPKKSASKTSVSEAKEETKSKRKRRRPRKTSSGDSS